MKTFFDYFRLRAGGDFEAPPKSANPVQSPFTPQHKAVSGSNESRDSSKVELGAVEDGERGGAGSGRGRNIALSEQPAESGSNGPRDRDILLELGDFLKRIPPEFLKPESHNGTRELRFDIDEVADNIAQGKATIPLSAIVKRCPDIFNEPFADHSRVEIYFPWQKLAKQEGIFKSRSSKGIPMPEGILPGKGAESMTWYSKGTGKPGKGSDQQDSKSLGKEAASSEASASEGNSEAQPAPDVANPSSADLKVSSRPVRDPVAEGRAEQLRIIEEAERRADQFATQCQIAIEERDAALRELSRLREEISRKNALAGGQDELSRKLLATLRVERDAAVEARDEAVVESKAERDELLQKVISLQSERDALRRERAQGAAQADQLRADHKKQIDFLNRDTERKVASFNRRLEAVQREREKVLADLRAQREKSNGEIEVLRSERNAVFKARDEAIAEAKATRMELQQHIDRLIRERNALTKNR